MMVLQHCYSTKHHLIVNFKVVHVRLRELHHVITYSFRASLEKITYSSELHQSLSKDFFISITAILPLFLDAMMFSECIHVTIICLFQRQTSSIKTFSFLKRGIGIPIISDTMEDR